MAGRDAGSDHETNVPGPLVKKRKLNLDMITVSSCSKEQDININIQSPVKESQSISQPQMIGDIVIEHRNDKVSGKFKFKDLHFLFFIPQADRVYSGIKCHNF